jgi:hypothetical protein
MSGSVDIMKPKSYLQQTGHLRQCQTLGQTVDTLTRTFAQNSSKIIADLWGFLIIATMGENMVQCTSIHREQTV